MNKFAITASALFAAVAASPAIAAPFEKVRFTSVEPGIELVGNLYLPQGAAAPKGVFVIIGPMTFQKEQAPTQYAQRLADKGYAALVFDARHRGESGGALRALEDPAMKAEDINSAVSFAMANAKLRGAPIYGLGICQGSSAMVVATADNPHIRATITLAGHYRDREGDIAWLTEAGFNQRLAQGDAAKAKFERTGAIDYIAAVDPVDMNVGMPGKVVWDWYGPWAARGEWDNRYAVMSDAALLRFESISAARRITKPYLMIHSDNSFLPDAARRHFDAMPSDHKKLLWEGDTPHLDYYDKAAILDRSVTSIVGWVDALPSS